MADIPMPLALIAWLPLFVSLLLVPVGLLFPGCPCCDDCGQDVYDEVYVTYSASRQVSNELSFGTVRYFDQPFPDHWYKPIFQQQPSYSVADGFFFLSSIPELEIGQSGFTNSAQVYNGFGVGTGYSIATSGSVACINIGRPQNSVLWRYVFNANYGGLGCESNGVDVVVMPTCPGLTAGSDRWTVSCYWCAGTSSQLFSHGNSSTPTAPRIPSTGQRTQERALVVTPVTFPSLFGNPAEIDPTAAAIRKSAFSSQGSGNSSGSASGLVPDFPSPHEAPTEETIGNVFRLGGVITTTFDFSSQPKQATTLNAYIGSTRPDYLVDAAATIAAGGSTLVNKPNPCSGSSCPTQSFYSQLTANSFWNSSWRAWAANPLDLGVNPAFFEIVGEASARTGPDSTSEDWYILKKLISNVQPSSVFGAFTPASTTSSAQITLDFP